jgi:hypothetical protein
MEVIDYTVENEVSPDERKGKWVNEVGWIGNRGLYSVCTELACSLPCSLCKN